MLGIVAHTDHLPPNPNKVLSNQISVKRGTCLSGEGRPTRSRNSPLSNSPCAPFLGQNKIWSSLRPEITRPFSRAPTCLFQSLILGTDLHHARPKHHCQAMTDTGTGAPFSLARRAAAERENSFSNPSRQRSNTTMFIPLEKSSDDFLVVLGAAGPIDGHILWEDTEQVRQPVVTNTVAAGNRHSWKVW